MNAPSLENVAREIAATKGLSVIRFCGKGAFKETYQTSSADGALALKLVDRDLIDQVRTDREIDALQRCRSPRIARLFSRSVHTTADGKVFDVVLEEFLDGGSLEERIQGDVLSQDQVLAMVQGLVLAVAELVPLRLVHRDIKPANIMFRKGCADPVLVDFGLVRDLAQTSLTHSWNPQGPGTPLYAPPEQLNNEKALIDWRADQFSIGVLASLLLTGRHPYQFESMNQSEAVHAVMERRDLAKEFIDEMESRDLSAFVRMVRQWPVMRYPTPEALLAELKI